MLAIFLITLRTQTSLFTIHYETIGIKNEHENNRMRSKYSLIIKHCTTYNYLSLNNHLCNSTYPKITEINVYIIKL